MNRKLKILLATISFLFISFLAKYVSEFSHEYLGHCLFSVLTGGGYTTYYVSWIWPYEFGYAHTYSNGFISEVLIISAGILVCFLISILINSLYYFLVYKPISNKIYLLIPIHFFFWLGFWTFVNSTGYLIVGGLINYGDIQNLSSTLGIKNWIFTIPGIVIFLILFYLISVNFFKLFKPLLEIKNRYILPILWILLLIIYFLFYFNPQIDMELSVFIVGLFVMLIPTLFTFLTVKYKVKLWKKIYDFNSNIHQSKST